MPNYAAYPANAKWKDRCVDVKMVGERRSVHNTGLVDEANIPQTWADLIDSKWKGQVMLSDSNTRVATHAMGAHDA